MASCLAYYPFWNSALCCCYSHVLHSSRGRASKHGCTWDHSPRNHLATFVRAPNSQCTWIYSQFESSRAYWVETCSQENQLHLFHGLRHLWEPHRYAPLIILAYTICLSILAHINWTQADQLKRIENGLQSLNCLTLIGPTFFHLCFPSLATFNSSFPFTTFSYFSSFSLYCMYSFLNFWTPRSSFPFCLVYAWFPSAYIQHPNTIFVSVTVPWACKFDGICNYFYSMLNVKYVSLPPDLWKGKHNEINTV